MTETPTEGTVLDQVMADPTSDESLLPPLNKIVAFAGPYIAIASGAIADWLLVHVHLLATFHLGHDTTANAVAQLLVFGIVTLVTYAGQHHWLKGWQKFEADMRLPILAEAKKVLDAGATTPAETDFDPVAAKAEMERRVGSPPAP
jgi:hypothetical protein